MAQQRPLSGRAMAAAAACLGFLFVFSVYWPADSTAVQAGAARYLVGLTLLAALAIAWQRATAGRRSGASPPAPTSACSSPGELVIESLTWALPFWMAISVWAHRDTANLRLAMNEWWWWLAAACLFSAARQVVRSGRSVTSAALGCYLALAAGVAVYGWYQWLIDIPLMIEMFEHNPDAVMRAAGIHAEPGSALRIVFQNRLYDGGPTGPFALANSMGVFLVGGCLVALGLVRAGWADWSRQQRLVWSLVLAVMLGMLLASRSRASLAALVLVLGGWAASQAVRYRRSGGPRWQMPSARSLLGWLAAGSGCLLAAGWLAWRLGRHSEWIGQAPLSLEIRLRYWWASAQMLRQSPWFGVGPGQFKARYENFRAASSTEQIADPHHWLWQVLTTGGLPAGLIAIALVVAIIRHRWQTCRQTAAPQAIAQSPPGQRLGHWLVGGGIAAVVAIWLVGAAIDQLPSLLPALLATFTGLAVAGLAARTLPAELPPPDGGGGIERAIAGWAALGMAINLLAAGGLLVPGVAVPLWLLLAIVATTDPPPRSSPAPPVAGRDRSLAEGSRPGKWLPLVGLLLLLIAWQATAVRPLERRAVAEALFARAWSFGHTAAAAEALQQAIEADRWDPQPPLQAVLAYTQLACEQPAQQATWRQAAQRAEQQVQQRSGGDPVPLRVLADSRLWLYQRYGEAGDLRQAGDWFQQAVQLAPSHETYAAQLAEVYRQLGDRRAVDVAQRAQTLSAAGGYYERSLPFLMLLPAQPLGGEVAAGPRKQSAAEILPPIVQQGNEQAFRGGRNGQADRQASKE